MNMDIRYPYLDAIEREALSDVVELFGDLDAGHLAGQGYPWAVHCRWCSNEITYRQKKSTERRRMGARRVEGRVCEMCDRKSSRYRIRLRW